MGQYLYVVLYRTLSLPNVLGVLNDIFHLFIKNIVNSILNSTGGHCLFYEHDQYLIYRAPDWFEICL